MPQNAAGITQEPHSGSVLVVDLAALAANYQILRARAGGAECGAVIKADAYGLGGERAAMALKAAGCRTFFVATLAEAQALRAVPALGPEAVRIFALNGVPPSEAQAVVEARVIPALNSMEDLTDWAAIARQSNRRIRCALHVDTGMNRLGLAEADVARLASNAGLLESLEVVLFISHLACAEETENPLNQTQRRRFEKAREMLRLTAPASLANSAGIFLGADFHYDLVRPGVALYGINPLINHANPMKEVVQLIGRIVQVRCVDTGGTVGYGATHLAARPARIATVAVGYADGYPRSLSNRGFGYVGDVRVPVVGRVSMDLTTFDVTAVDPAVVRPGAFIELIGGRASIEEVADAAGTIPYEILTRLGRRYVRTYAGAEPTL